MMITIARPRGDETIAISVTNDELTVTPEQLQEYKEYLETRLKTTMSLEDFIQMTTPQQE
jgi:hypothetical protein